MLSQTVVMATHYEPQWEGLRTVSTRIILAAGAGSEGELANRGAHATAERLGVPLVIFPGDHGGFLGGEYGQTGQPDEFAATLREALSQS